eukprot:gene3031-5941_t
MLNISWNLLSLLVIPLFLVDCTNHQTGNPTGLYPNISTASKHPTSEFHVMSTMITSPTQQPSSLSCLYSLPRLKTDYPKNDISNSTVANLYECKNLCCLNVNCTGIVIDAMTSICYLKSVMDPLPAATRQISKVLSYSDCTFIGKPEMGYAYPGNDIIEPFYGTGIGMCQEQCCQEVGCQGVEFDLQSLFCPSASPTKRPTRTPVKSPTRIPLVPPSTTPSTDTPSGNPTGLPSISLSPTVHSINSSSSEPSMSTSVSPSKYPNVKPTQKPSFKPSVTPWMNDIPSAQPVVTTFSISSVPTTLHSTSPTSSSSSASPTILPVNRTTPTPTITPTTKPSQFPSHFSFSCKEYDLCFEYTDVSSSTQMQIQQNRWKSFVTNNLITTTTTTTTIFTPAHTPAITPAISPSVAVNMIFVCTNETAVSMIVHAITNSHTYKFQLQSVFLLSGSLSVGFYTITADTVPRIKHMTVIPTSTSILISVDLSVLVQAASSTSTSSSSTGMSCGRIYCNAFGNNDILSSSSSVSSSSPLVSHMILKLSPFQTNIIINDNNNTSTTTTTSTTVEMAISDLISLQQYTVYCYVEDLFGNGLSQLEVQDTKTVTSTLCCRDIKILTAPKYIYEDILSSNDISSRSGQSSTSSSTMLLSLSDYIFRYTITALPDVSITVTPVIRRYTTAATTQSIPFQIFSLSSSSSTSTTTTRLLLPSPNIISFQFSSSGRTAVATFDSPTNQGNGNGNGYNNGNNQGYVNNTNIQTPSQPSQPSQPQYGVWGCDQIFTFTGAGFSSCVWVNSSAVLVTFQYIDMDHVNMVKVGDTVSVHSGSVLSALCVSLQQQQQHINCTGDTSSSSSSSSVVAAPPSRLPSPVIVLTVLSSDGSGVIGPCANLTLD